MTPVFLDSVGLLALWDEADQWHEAAEQAHEKLDKMGVRLFTTNFILLECGNAAARKPYRDKVDDLRLALDTAGQLVAVTDGDVRNAWQDYRANHYGSAGIVDHVSFHVMSRLGIQKAFTNDRHFEAAGFETLF